MPTAPDEAPTPSAGDGPVARAQADLGDRLSWRRSDFESRLGISGGRFTSPRTGLWLVVAAVLTVGFYVVLSLLPSSWWVEVFTGRGPVPYFVVLLGWWAVLLLVVKFGKVSIQSRALAIEDVVPSSPDFVLSPGTVPQVTQRLKERCADPERFVLFNRITFALSNLKNMGRISDVDSVLATRAELDADAAESSYTLLRGLVWAIPVLGFVGTVQGLSVSLGAFGEVIQDTSDFEAIKPALRSVTGGLATAFDTTLLALVVALLIQLLLTLVRKREEDLLDSASEYCLRHVVGRLRVSPFDAPGNGAVAGRHA